jgi:hypothetical protein
MVVRQGEDEQGGGAAGDVIRETEPLPFAIEDGASQPSGEISGESSEMSPEPSSESPPEPSHQPPAEPIEIPLVMPGGAAAPFRRRRARRVALVVAALALLVAGRLLYQRFTDVRPGSSTTFSSIGLEELAPELRVVAETFQGSAQRYAERTADFNLGRLGCEGLWTGYRGVDEAFIALSEQHASLGGGEMADRVLVSSERSMEEIEQHYESTECPRRN